MMNALLLLKPRAGRALLFIHLLMGVICFAPQSDEPAHRASAEHQAPRAAHACKPGGERVQTQVSAVTSCRCTAKRILS